MKKRLLSELIPWAETFLSNKGCGSGTNYTTPQVGSLMALFALEVINSDAQTEEMVKFAEGYAKSKLPSEEEIEREFKEYLQIDIIPDKDDPDHYDYSWSRVVWMACYDHIKKLFER